MTLRFCVIILMTITLTAATLVGTSHGASLQSNSHGDNKSTNRFLRVTNSENEERIVAMEAIESLAKNKNVVIKIMEADEIPEKVAAVVKKYPLVIPGVSAAIIRVRLKLWYWWRVPPTVVFKALGLRGYSAEINKNVIPPTSELKSHPFYKYFKEYRDKWVNNQKFLEF
ncbi:Secreted RxLR effector peptide protein [Phytophthora palmivora]|uniref:Secreted RxLR effector peptide protein n=1 Tax=Phytophthora palmivora TaxID=4796 RepID=A0A2P4XKH6_9STRA|nr:Secreted RxLR effector peptide protein [Phytophthora palmivora]